MTYYGAKELAESFRTVRKNTIAIANDIPEQHYGFRATPESRSIAQTLVHICFAPKLQEQIHGAERRTTLVGFDFPAYVAAVTAEQQKSLSKAEIIQLLEQSGNRFASWLESLSDSFLAERVAMPAGATPDSKTRFEMILGVKEHEMHHRGQLMLLERMVGVVPHLTRQMQERFAAMAAQKS